MSQQQWFSQKEHLRNMLQRAQNLYRRADLTLNQKTKLQHIIEYRQKKLINWYLGRKTTLA